MKILVIAPHPDDEVLGCGGSIARHAEAGDDIDLCIVTTTYPPEWDDNFRVNRDKEIAAAARILGVKSVYNMALPTVKLDTLPEKDITDALSAVIRQSSPNIVYIPFRGDLNLDHRIIHETALVALRPHIAGTVSLILAYETLSETEWGLMEFTPTFYRDITGQFDKKIAAMEAYASEIRKENHPRTPSGIEALARLRGSEVNIRYAEAFVLVRGIY
jgi:LmbE family N-acetylglucosaminyl deacetylase